MEVAVEKESSNPVRVAALKVAKVEVNVRTPHLAVFLSAKMLHRAARKKAEHRVASGRRTKAELETVRQLLYARKRSKSHVDAARKIG